MPRKNRARHTPRRKTYDNPHEVPRYLRTGSSQTKTMHTLVLPVGRCGRKLMFTAADAPEALRQAQAKHSHATSNTKVEKRHYTCPTCGHEHLTSRDTWEDRSNG